MKAGETRDLDVLLPERLEPLHPLVVEELLQLLTLLLPDFLERAADLLRLHPPGLDLEPNGLHRRRRAGESRRSVPSSAAVWRTLVALEWGFHPQMPHLACGRTVVSRGIAGEVHCSKTKLPGPKIEAYVEQPQNEPGARWLPVSYNPFGTGAVCSRDGARVAMLW